MPETEIGSVFIEIWKTEPESSQNHEIRIRILNPVYTVHILLQATAGLDGAVVLYSFVQPYQLEVQQYIQVKQTFPVFQLLCDDNRLLDGIW